MKKKFISLGETSSYGCR